MLYILMNVSSQVSLIVTRTYIHVYCCTVHVSTYQGVHVSTYPRFHVITYPRINVSTYIRIHVSTYPRIYESAYPRIYVSTYPRIYESTFPRIHYTALYYKHKPTTLCILNSILRHIVRSGEKVHSLRVFQPLPTLTLPPT